MRCYLDSLGLHTISLRQVLLTVRALFRGHPFFGPLLFMALTVVLLLPPFGGASTDAVKYACWLIGFGLLCFSVRAELASAAGPVVTRWVCVWIGWITLSVFLSRDYLYAFLGNYPRYNSSWFLYAGFGILLFCLTALGKRYEKALVGILLVCSFAVSLFGILQGFGIGYYGGIASLLSPVPDRVFSLLGNPNFSAWFVAASMPFGIVAGLRSRTMWRLVAWIFYLFVSMWSVAMFASRGAWLALGAGWLVLLVAMLIMRRWRAMLVVVVVGICATLLFGGYYRLYRPLAVTGQANISAFQDSSASDRFVAWDMAGVFFREHPFSGIGPGNFDQYYWERLPSALMGGYQYFDDAHNFFLVLLVDLGLPGFGLFALLCALAAVIALRRLRESKDLDWCLAATSALSVWLVASVFNPAVIPAWFQLAVLFALIFVQHPTAVRAMRVSLWQRLSLRLVGLVCVLLAIGLVVGEYSLVYIQSIEGYRLFSPAVLPRQKKWADRARWIEPYNPEVRFAATATDLYAGGSLTTARSEVASTFRMHPYSARSALLSAQLTADIWKKSQDPSDLTDAQKYLKTALASSSGYPVVPAWAAYFYWSVGNMPEAERFARIASARQPGYYYNWLLLAKLYREAGNLRGMEFALAKAQEITPENPDLAKLRRQLHESKSVTSVDIRPGEPSILARLHN